MGTVSPAEFETIARKTIETVGLDPAPETFHWENNRYTNELIMQDASGMTDIRIMRHHIQGSDWPARLRMHEGSGSTTPLFNGMLDRRHGTYDITIKPDRPRYATPTKHLIDVDTVSSPQAINQAQIDLGRTLGVDAFRLRRMPSKEEYTAGEWIEGVANMEIPVADLTDWYYAEHDTHPNLHVQSWIMTPPHLCQAIGDRAARLIEAYGDRIHETLPTRPAEVGNFAFAMDSLQGFTRPLLGIVGDIGSTEHGRLRSPLVALWHEANLRPQTVFDAEDQDVKIKIQSDTMTRLGLVPQGLSWESRKRELKRITANYVAHIARTLVTIEEIRPRENEGTHHKEARKKLLHAVADRFDDTVNE